MSERTSPRTKSVIPIERNADAGEDPVRTYRIDQAIYVIRGQKVMLDSDLAILYGVGTKVLNQTVARNKERFPDDFMFRLTTEEFAALRLQIETSNEDPASKDESFEVTDCDLKRQRWAADGSVCVHRARRRHALRPPE